MPYLYSVEVRESSIQGKGLFALQDIPKGTVYWSWTNNSMAPVQGFTVGENLVYTRE